MNKLNNIWNFIKKIPTIIRAKLKDKSNLESEEWYKNRIETCKSCPLLSTNTEGTKGWKYKILDLLNFKQAFCTVCGCEIKAKASEKLESCPEGKWKQIRD